MTDAKKISTLRSAIERADKALNRILEPSSAAVGSFASGRKPSEWAMTTASCVRRILRAAMRKTMPDETGTKTAFKFPDVKIDIQAMKANGTLKEAKPK